jgi:hypothetical protein
VICETQEYVMMENISSSGIAYNFTDKVSYNRMFQEVPYLLWLIGNADQILFFMSRSTTVKKKE